MKVALSGIKKNLQRTNGVGNEAGTQINNLEHKQEISIQQNSKKEKEF